jgi:tetratricopeptide (TPR) repeat protein
MHPGEGAVGLLSWLLGPGDPDARVAAAQKLLATGRYNDARLAVEDLAATHDGARGVAGAAAAGLCRLNAETAVGLANRGIGDKAEEHLLLARAFRDEAAQRGRDVGDLDAVLRAGLSGARDGLHAREQAPPPRRSPPREGARNPFERPDEVQDERAIRVAFYAEGLPTELRAGFPALGPAFAAAVLAREEGDCDAALQALAALEDAPLVWWERAQNAAALGDLHAAIRAANAFAAGAAHQRIGNVHTGEWLAARLAEAGHIDQALAAIRAVRATDPGVGRFLHASLLEASGALAEADAMLVAMARDLPNEMGIYAMLGRIRVAGGQRMEAMRALEAGLNQCACGTGRCGAPEPSLAIVRPLAVLYLEDGLDPARGHELAAQAHAMMQKPTWEDIYLAALTRRGTPEGSDMAAALRERTPPDDPRAERVRRYLWADAAP